MVKTEPNNYTEERDSLTIFRALIWMLEMSDRPAILIKCTPAQAEGCNSTPLKSMANFPLIFNKGGFAERIASVS